MQDLVLESAKYMVLGMGIVYLLLLLIIFLTNLQSRVIAKFFANNTDVNVEKNLPIEAKSKSEDKAVVAAIVAAVSAYKKGR